MESGGGPGVCRVMGIINVTPDSFSDGGRYYRPEEALARAVNCLEEGADIVLFPEKNEPWNNILCLCGRRFPYCNGNRFAGCEL